VPNQTWVFCALVIEPEGATVYLGDGGVLSSARNETYHAPEAFNASLVIGSHQILPARRFQGWLDDVRIFEASMNEAQVDDLYRSY